MQAASATSGLLLAEAPSIPGTRVRSTATNAAPPPCSRDIRYGSLELLADDNNESFNSGHSRYNDTKTKITSQRAECYKGSFTLCHIESSSELIVKEPVSEISRNGSDCKWTYAENTGEQSEVGISHRTVTLDFNARLIPPRDDTPCAVTNGHKCLLHRGSLKQKCETTLDEESEEQELDLTNSGVVTKYKAMAETVNTALQLVLPECQPKAKIVDFCEKAYSFSKEKTWYMYKKVKRRERWVTSPKGILVTIVVDNGFEGRLWIIHVIHVIPLIESGVLRGTDDEQGFSFKLRGYARVNFHNSFTDFVAVGANLEYNGLKGELSYMVHDPGMAMAAMENVEQQWRTLANSLIVGENDSENQMCSLLLASLMAGTGYGRAIGIDLGTTYSCVAAWKHDRIEIIPNDQGNRTTPSYVAFTATERLIGDAAKNQIANNPINTVFGQFSLLFLMVVIIFIVYLHLSLLRPPTN
ncbi:hypothetical protein SASPL_145932 [Salvia splendens]|uniref:Heat shock 70kDa protein 1/8 n=1 Tax=Salvia splendens TaxID=180675 RepID=A0A8X8WIC4_SALSN|nr:hypothetical protein SASPL_145932 [Salvia splendens]